MQYNTVSQVYRLVSALFSTTLSQVYVQICISAVTVTVLCTDLYQYCILSGYYYCGYSTVSLVVSVNWLISSLLKIVFKH